jgi:hypothetical protein
MVTDTSRRALLTAALGFLELRPALPEVRPLRRWLNSWRGLGDMVPGVNAQGYDLELRQSPRDWRANLYPTGNAHSIVVASARERTPWRAVQRAAWDSMIATDDVRHRQKLLMLAWDGGETATPSDRYIHNGEVGHLFRLLCGHLYEAATPFRALDQVARDRLHAAVADDAEHRAAFAEVRVAYAENRPDGLRYSFLYAMRNSFAFH